MLGERARNLLEPREEVVPARVPRRFQGKKFWGQRYAPIAGGVGETPHRGDLHLQASGSEHDPLDLFGPQDWIALADGLLKWRNEISLLDGDHQREAKLRDHAHEGRVAQGNLDGHRGGERIDVGHGVRVTHRRWNVKW